MRAKHDGVWITGFNPAEVNYHFTEANSWQYTFYVPQDISGLIELYGGKQHLETKLDSLFAVPSETAGRKQVDITGLIGQYAHGNEPSHHMAYLYNFINKPWKTQQRVRQIINEMYSTKPDGLIGNEDCGQMSSWYVFSAMGFYPVTPASNYYVIGTPIFEEISINLENGKIFTVKANNVSAENIYIQSASLNGTDYTKSYIAHESIMAGGELTFEMGNKPKESWGSAENDIPRTSIEEHLIMPSPYIKAVNRTFTDSLKIEMACLNKKAAIFYKTSENEDFKEYSGELWIKENTIFQFYAAKNGDKSAEIKAEFAKIPAGRNLILNTEYSYQYPAGGNLALIDGLKGEDDYRIGTWQGYYGQNIEAIVDLGGEKNIKSMSIGFIQDINSWIFMPESVSFLTSIDGENFSKPVEIQNDIEENNWNVTIKRFLLEKRIKTRYIKVIAKNRIMCPDWHKGAGNKAWIFADEIEILF